MIYTAVAPQFTKSVDARDHIRGNAAASVTVVEYGDYACPACRDADMNRACRLEWLSLRMGRRSKQ